MKELIVVDNELIIVFDPSFLDFFDGRVLDKLIGCAENIRIGYWTKKSR